MTLARETRRGRTRAPRATPAAVDGLSDRPDVHGAHRRGAATRCHTRPGRSAKPTLNKYFAFVTAPCPASLMAGRPRTVIHGYMGKGEALRVPEDFPREHLNQVTSKEIKYV